MIRRLLEASDYAAPAREDDTPVHVTVRCRRARPISRGNRRARWGLCRTAISPLLPAISGASVRSSPVYDTGRHRSDRLLPAGVRRRGTSGRRGPLVPRRGPGTGRGDRGEPGRRPPARDGGSDARTDRGTPRHAVPVPAAAWRRRRGLRVGPAPDCRVGGGRVPGHRSGVGQEAVDRAAKPLRHRLLTRARSVAFGFGLVHDVPGPPPDINSLHGPE
jgi:hypothetical protein